MCGSGDARRRNPLRRCRWHEPGAVGDGELGSAAGTAAAPVVAAPGIPGVMVPQPLPALPALPSPSPPPSAAKRRRARAPSVAACAPAESSSPEPGRGRQPGEINRDDGLEKKTGDHPLHDSGEEMVSSSPQAGRADHAGGPLCDLEEGILELIVSRAPCGR